MAEAPSQLRVLLAGAGAFGQEHLCRLIERHDIRVAAVADPSARALDAVRQRHGSVSCFEDPQRMLDQTPADAVIVATPAASHAAITLQAIAKRLGVLLEKPVTPGPAEAEGLAKAAADAGTLVLPGHVLRFSRDHRKLVEIAASGILGRILYIRSRRYRDDTHAARYRDTDPVLMTMIHDIDLALWIAGSPFRSARAWRSGGGFRSLTTATAVTESGAICELQTAWTFTPGETPPDRVEVVGETGSIELDTGHGLVLHAEGRRSLISLAMNDDALANEHDHFFACLRDRNAAPALTLRDAMAGLRLAGALCDSLRDCRNVRLGA
jgi:predicted dehydrogenase